MAVQAVFVPVTGEGELRQAAALAEEIWQEHYAGILDPGQIRYMVDTFQSPEAIEKIWRRGMHTG